ncbi:hypothetical protein P9112_005805 [Eukaryota sp. TZLM1-RC]
MYPAHPPRRSLRDDYINMLGLLRYNQLHEIQRLTQIAAMHINNAPDVVYAIEYRIHNAHPHEKLPALYLADCIVKNVGGIYLQLFSESMDRLFFEVYNTCDPATKHELLTLLGTWKPLLPYVYRTISEKLSPPVPTRPHVIGTTSTPSTTVQQSLSKATRKDIVEKMYSRPSQCPLCAIRFEDDDSRNKHMDSHVETSKKSKLQKRSLYLDANNWVTYGTKQRAESLTTPEPQTEKKPRVSADSVSTDMKACPVCAEEFNLEYDEDEDEWMYDDVVLDDDGVLYHSTCFSQVDYKFAGKKRLSEGHVEAKKVKHGD